MHFQFESEGNWIHWVVRVMEKGRVIETHRFYRARDKFIYHRGEHGKHEVEARAALVEHLKKNPELVEHVPVLREAEHSTMHVRQIAAGGSKRG